MANLPEAGEFKDTGEELYHEGQVIFFNIQQYVKGVDGSIIPEADFIDEPQANEPGDEPSDPNDDQQKSTEQGNDGEIVTTQPDGSVVIVDVDGDASGRSKEGSQGLPYFDPSASTSSQLPPQQQQRPLRPTVVKPAIHLSLINLRSTANEQMELLNSFDKAQRQREQQDQTKFPTNVDHFAPQTFVDNNLGYFFLRSLRPPKTFRKTQLRFSLQIRWLPPQMTIHKQ